MIDLDEYLAALGEETGEDQEEKDNKAYQKQLFLDYVLRKEDHLEVRKELKRRFDTGAELTGPKGLRKQLAAFDLGYFGRAYLKHYFVRPSPASDLVGRDLDERSAEKAEPLHGCC